MSTRRINPLDEQTSCSPPKSLLSSVGPTTLAGLLPGRSVRVLRLSSLMSVDERSPVFIYSCPSTSPVKHRMLYSSGSGAVYRTASSLLSSIDGASPLATRKVETSDPKEINKTFLTNELASSSTSSSSSSILTRANLGSTDGGNGVSTEAQRSVRELTQQFSRPRAPARKRP